MPITLIVARPVCHGVKKREDGRCAFCICEIFPEYILIEHFPPSLTCRKTNVPAAAMAVNKNKSLF
ncbi:hypothetical protein I79_017767 [Cricetulus griseus]|uniref:Uncharacterized protein n=1 Tax=Cricetulus griseus TaxID=10029 RepID=G3I2X2_CRIGR|nr:hypothetical protein I79_017767 [Cricetulus griseus]